MAVADRVLLALGPAQLLQPDQAANIIIGFGRISAVSTETFGRFAPAPVDSIVDGVNAPDAFGNLGVRVAETGGDSGFPCSAASIAHRY